jgi:hypothetical protein
VQNELRWRRLLARRKKAEVAETYFETVPYMEINGFPIHAGEVIKVNGQWGSKFKFIGITTNKLTGASWVDCFEIIGGVPSVFRSFKQDKVKRIPKRGKRAKRVV